MSINKGVLEKAFLIRHFEEKLLELFAEGKLNGTVHTCSGQEWGAVAMGEALGPEDAVFSNHRGHGHFLARHSDVNGLMAEVMGRASGVCGGIGGTQHLYARNHFSNGILGGMAPVSGGYALGHRLDERDCISVLCVGDGTMGEGVFYESLNLMAKWELPVMVMVENNAYAQSTATKTTTAGTIEGRAQAFGIEYRRGSTRQHVDLMGMVREAVEWCRKQKKPIVVEIETFRLNAHSKGDDNRDLALLRQQKELDPLNQFAKENRPQYDEILKRHQTLLAEAETKALRSPLCQYRPRRQAGESPSWRTAPELPESRYGDLIYQGLDKALSQNPGLVLIGEDIEGPYGGAFKVTKDLSQKYPGRVRNTPISEAAIVGFGTGLALSGHPCVVEIMFGDFLTLAFDQIYQHASKFRALFNEQVRVPLVIRTPMGGRRGYGPTHSQSIEKHFLGIPGLDVLALNRRIDPVRFYESLLQTIEHPALVIENKILYTRSARQAVPDGYVVEVSDESFPTVRLRPKREARAQVTIACYGGMLEEVEAALEPLFYEHEILCEIICPTLLSPLGSSVPTLAVGTGKLFVVEEGCNEAAWSSELITQSTQRAQIKAGRLSFNGMIPACLPLEQELLPNRSAIVKAITEFV